MTTILNAWQFWLVSYLIFVVIFYQSYKAAVANAQKDGAATILLQIIGAASILLLVPFFKSEFALSWKPWLLLLFACVFYALNDRINTTVRKNLPVSTFSIVSQSTVVFMMLIGFLVYKENVTVFKLLGAVFIIIANVLLTYRKGQVVINKYVSLAFIAAFVIAIAISIDIGISELFNLPVYIALTLGIPAFFVAGAERIKLKEILNEFNSENRKFYFIAGISWGLTILSLLRAYQLGNVTTIVPLSSVSTLLNVLVAYVIFNERDARLKKLIAAVLVVIGISFTVL